MTPDEYLRGILAREAVNTGLASPAWLVQSALTPLIREWANGRLLDLHASGSFMKGTANSSGTDVDLFISLSEDTIETLAQIHDKLFLWLTNHSYTPKRQNVSINILVNGHSVDLVPGKRQNAYSTDHSLYRRRADTWTKTNVQTHINTVVNSGCREEIRVLKLWRNQRDLDFPSFYLELTVMAALPPIVYDSLSNKVWRVLEYLRDKFVDARVLDPANTNNLLSDDLNTSEKRKIQAASVTSLGASNWSQIVT